ncbi:MAG: ATP-binding protein, partial [Actinomycetota bacterium]
EYNLDLKIRIGINTGPVILGNVGSVASGAYSAVGDTLNTAARVQAAAEPATVAVTDDTFRLVASFFRAEDLGEVEVKGKSAPVHCHRIIGPRTDPLSVPEQGPLIGREAEVARLHRLLGALQHGRGGVVFVTGEPGIGKSRLLREARSASDFGELSWLEGRSVSYGAGVGYGLIAQIVRSLAGTEAATAAEEAAVAVDETVRRIIGDEASQEFGYLAHLLAIPVEASGSLVDEEPEALQQGYLASLTSLFRLASKQLPVVIVCEDLHWADDSSVELLSRLLPVARDSRVMFLFTSRREPQTAGWRLLREARDGFGEALAEINLDSLSREESSAFAAQLLGETASRSLVGAVYELTEGNPLFIEEVARTYLSTPLAGDTAERKGSVLEGSPSLHSLLLSSIDRLPPDARRLLKVASVIGPDFSVGVLEMVGEADTSRQLSALESAGLVQISDVHPELQYSFRHSLLQEAAYGALLRSERKKLHAGVAEAIEGLYPHRTGELAGLLARHYAEAGDDERTLDYSIMAADDAFARYAISEASAHYRRAADLAAGRPDLDLVHLFLRLGRTLELTDRYEEAVEAYRQLRAIGRERNDSRLELAGLLAGATALVTPAGLQDINESERLAQRGLQLARKISDRAAEGRSLWNLMMARNFSGGSPQEAVKFGEEALAIARELGDPEQVASTLLDLHWSYLAAGEMEHSAAALEECIELWRRTGDRVMLADSLTCMSGLSLLQGDMEGVFKRAGEARIISEESGNLWGQSICRTFAGLAYRELGDLDNAITQLREAVAIGEEINLAGGRALGADLGLALALSGSVEEGLQEARKAFDSTAENALRPWAAASFARTLIVAGDFQGASEVLAPYKDPAEVGLAMPLPIRFILTLAKAELALAQGDPPGCLGLLQKMTEELRRMNIKYWLSEAASLEAAAKNSG